MKEKILKIEPFEDLIGHEEGYTITTDVQQIIVGMETYQDCCEDGFLVSKETGFLVSNDNFKDFVGETISEIYITDEKLKSYDVEVTILNDNYHDNYVDLENVFFINFEMESSCEILQFVAYNCHNGSYGYDAFIKTEKLIIKKEV